MRYLARYRVTINFPAARLYLAKGKHFSDRERGHTCGLGYLFKPNGLLVEMVNPEGPAQAAGIRPGDVIVRLSGKAVDAWKPSEINQLLAAEGKPVRLVVQRDGKTADVEFTPREFD